MNRPEKADGEAPAADEEGLLNERIEALRNALVAMGVLAVLTFLTSVDRIDLATQIATYDRYLIEHFPAREHGNDAIRTR